jgi:hypothetical protein
MANGIQPQGYFTTDPVLGGGSGALRNLLDPADPAGAYRAFLNSRLFPANVGDYQNITSSGQLASGPFNLIPTGEGLTTALAGAVNPITGIAARGAINRRNAEALETLANLGILETITPADASKGFTKFLGYEFTPGTGEYRLSPEVELAIQQSGSTPQEYFESQYKSQFGAANELAQYLDQIAYTTQGNFFTKDFFGNPTPWSKYIDRQGNIKADALEQWEKFGQKDKMGVLAAFMDDDDNQGTQQSSSNQGSTAGGGIDDLFKGQVSEPMGSTPDFLQSSSNNSGGAPKESYTKYDPVSGRMRKVAGGTTNLFLN